MYGNLKTAACYNLASNLHNYFIYTCTFVDDIRRKSCQLNDYIGGLTPARLNIEQWIAMV